MVTLLLGAITLLWAILAFCAVRGINGLPRLSAASLIPDADCPPVSILFSARDEAEQLPQALASLLTQDYPHYQVIAVDDRSSDATGRILDEFAAHYPHLKVIHLTEELPPGWLGKPHGLQCAYEASSGAWLVFTDADVRFETEVLRRAMGLVLQYRWDHLTLLGVVDMVGFWEKVALTYFMAGFILGFQPWYVSDPHSRHYIGVGTFQLIRRSAYEAIGTHRRLALEVVDDMKLGKLLKQGGFRSGVAVAGEAVAVRWHAGLANIIRGTTKNLFAADNFNPGRVLMRALGLIVMNLLPVAAVLVASDLLDRVLGVTATVIAAGLQGYSTRGSGRSMLYGLTHPLGTVIFCYMLARSMAVTLWRGGVLWRDTFYPLEQLKRGRV
jgi:hypothetical protein